MACCIRFAHLHTYIVPATDLTYWLASVFSARTTLVNVNVRRYIGADSPEKTDASLRGNFFGNHTQFRADSPHFLIGTGTYHIHPLLTLHCHTRQDKTSAKLFVCYCYTYMYLYEVLYIYHMTNIFPYHVTAIKLKTDHHPSVQLFTLGTRALCSAPGRA